MEVVWEELEGPSMHTSLLDVVVSPKDDSDTLYNLLIVGLLVDAVSGCNVGDADIFNSQTDIFFR